MAGCNVSLLKLTCTFSFSGDYFYSCNAFHKFVRWKAGSESFIVVNATEEPLILERQGNADLHVSVSGPSCSWAYIYTSGYGQTMLHATLSKEYHHYDNSFHEPIILKASTRIAAYPPLVLHQVSNGNQFGGYWFNFSESEASNQLENLRRVNLVPGTSLDIMLRGGPERWDKDVGFIENVEILDDKHTHIKDGVLVHSVSGRHQSVYRVLCQNLGIFVSSKLLTAVSLSLFLSSILLLLTCYTSDTFFIVLLPPF